MKKTVDTLPLISKIEELTGTFKKDFDLNSFEDSLVKCMYDFLAPIIQESIESLMHEPVFLSLLKVIGGKKCLKLDGFRLVDIHILDGRNVLVSSPYFCNRSKQKPGRKKQKRSKGNNLDCHLGLSRIGIVSHFSGNLASEICKMAILSPSIELAGRLLSERGVIIDEKTIRNVVRDVGQIGLANRGSISIGNNEQIEGGTLIIGADGGRIRERKDKKGRRKKGQKIKSYHTDWKEPVLFTMYLTDSEGIIDKSFTPIYDATMQGKDYTFKLIKSYLESLDCKKISRIVFVGDGAPWIWLRVEELFNDYFQEKPTFQILDYTHAKQALNEILDLLPKKLQKRGKLIDSFRQRLWQGDIEGIGEMIKINFIGKGRVKALNKWKNYFLKNKDRMQYSQFKTKRLPQGSGSVESAIRRVINLRLKSSGSFWKKENAEIYLFLRSQLISGRWNVFFENLINRLDYDEYKANIKTNAYMKWAA
jgi:hypothetical protein